MRRVAASYLCTVSSATLLRNAYVEYSDDGTITSVGLCDDISSEENFIEGMVVPGFVNSHCHVELSYRLGLFRRGTGMAGFIDQINSLRDTGTREERMAAIRARMKDMWNSGVSAMADISNCSESFAAKASSPMYVRTFLEVFGTRKEDCPSIISDVLKLKEEAEGLGLDAAPTPHACYTMSPELITASSAEGLRSGFLSYHSEESPEEEEMLISGSGPMYENRVRCGLETPPVTGKSSLLYFLDRLREVHPAPFGEHILLVHEVCLDQEGIDAVKEMMDHPFIALCPKSNIFIHNALPPVELMRRSGIRLTIGTDSLSSNDDLDMVSEMFCLQENFPQVPLGEIVEWATLGGAEFLGKEDVLGTIEPGKRPGLVAIDHISPSGALTTASRSRRIV